MKPHTDYDYNYFALFQGLCVLVLVAGLVILALNNRDALRRGMRYLGAWYRERRGDVLNVAFLFATAGISWLGVWAWWILTHGPE